MGSGEGVYVPGEVLLGASPKGTQLFALVYELLQAASWNGVVAAVDNSPLGRFVPVIVPPPAQGLLDPPQGARLRPTLNLPFLVCSQKCVMPRKSNVLSTLPVVRSGKPTELDDFPGAVQVGQSLPKVSEKAPRVAQMLKAAHEVVRIADNDRVASSHPLAPMVLEPVARSAGRRSQGMAPPLAVFPCQSVPSMTPASLDDQTPRSVSRASRLDGRGRDCRRTHGCRRQRSS